MKIINIILLIFQRSLGDFYYILQQRGILAWEYDERTPSGPQSERAECEDLT